MNPERERLVHLLTVAVTGQNGDLQQRLKVVLVIVHRIAADMVDALAGIGGRARHVLWHQYCPVAVGEVYQQVRIALLGKGGLERRLGRRLLRHALRTPSAAQGRFLKKAIVGKTLAP